jgi:hypothetical protein
MWLVIVGVLSLGLGFLALVGLVAVARELICESSPEVKFTDDGGAADRGDIGRVSGRRALTR